MKLIFSLIKYFFKKYVKFKVLLFFIKDKIKYLIINYEILIYRVE